MEYLDKTLKISSFLFKANDQLLKINTYFKNGSITANEAFDYIIQLEKNVRSTFKILSRAPYDKEYTYLVFSGQFDLLEERIESMKDFVNGKKSDSSIQI